MKIINAEFVSEWDGGIQIVTSCKVDLGTKEVFDIEQFNTEIDLNILEKEFIIINGENYPVFQISDITEEDNEYWYE